MLKISFSKRKYYLSITKLLVVPLFCFVVAIVIFYFSLPRLLASAATLASVGTFYIGYFSYPFLSKKLSILDSKIDSVYAKYEDPLLKERDSAKRGMVGEAEIYEWLKEVFSKESYVIIPNLVIPGNKFDIDFVVFGPKGIFVFEVKNFSEKVFFTTEDYAYINKSGEMIKLSPHDDPRNQLRWNISRLQEFLNKNGVPQMIIKCALVFPEADSMLFLGKPLIYLIDNKEKLRHFVHETKENPIFTPEFCGKLLSLLK